MSVSFPWRLMETRLVFGALLVVCLVGCSPTEPSAKPDLAAEPAPTTAPAEPPAVEAEMPAEPSPPAESTPAEEPSAEAPPERSVNPLRPKEMPVADESPKPAETEPAAAKPVEHAKSDTKGSIKSKREPFDPVKVNGPIFVGWPKPKLAIVITGRQDGYLEPCGCAGLDRMKGGLSRRHSLFKALRKDGLPVVGLDVGGLCKGFGRQAELKLQTTVEAMRKMGYDAIGMGTTDLKFPTAELVAVAAGVNGEPSRFISANVGLFGFEAKLTERFRIIEAGGMKVGVTSVLGKQAQKELNNQEIELADPQAALVNVLPELKGKCDLLVLLAHASMKESIELAKRFPEFNIVVTAGGAPEPPAKPAIFEGSKTLIIEVGEKGMDAIVLGIFDSEAQPLRYQRVPLDSRFESSEDMRLLMAAYQDQLRGLGYEGLGIRAVPHPQKELLGDYIGSKKCESCHEESYTVWKKSGHAKAHRTLVELKPPRQFDPECLSCHVIGWDPRHHFPYQGGYLSLEKTPDRLDVGCENCHGPGEAHAKAETGGNMALQEKLQKAVRVTKEEAKQRQCLNCHDLDNSPDFDFDTYWPHVEHSEDE